MKNSRPVPKKRKHISEFTPDQLKKMVREQLLALETTTIEERKQIILLIHQSDESELYALLEHEKLLLTTIADDMELVETYMRFMGPDDVRKESKKQLKAAIDAVIPWTELLEDPVKYEEYKKIVLDDAKILYNNRTQNSSLNGVSFETFIKDEALAYSMELKIKLLAIQEEYRAINALYKTSDEILCKSMVLLEPKIEARKKEEEALKLNKQKNDSPNGQIRIFAAIGVGISFGTLCTGIYTTAIDNIDPVVASIIAVCSAAVGGAGAALASDCKIHDLPKNIIDKIYSRSCPQFELN